jgi:PAS domain S-box-containing protein
MSARHILVVDDERIVAAGIKNELENFGYEVSGVASSADTAVEHAVRDKPDLVLMDIHLKGERDGIDASREIRARCGTPVVYLSAFADAETIARAAETEAYGYLLKPYEERELQTTIEVALAKHAAAERLAETERWMAGVLGGIEDAVIAADSDNRIRFINLAGEALTGWRKADAVGSQLEAVCVLVEPRGRISLGELADQAVCENRIVDVPAGVQLVGRNGSETVVEGCLSPIFDPRGEFLGTALTLRDVEMPKPRGTSTTILLAEAEPLVRDFSRLVLEEQGYRVLVAEDGIQAVEVFRQFPEQIDLVIIDLTIPRLSADAVFARLLQLNPNVAAIFSSGYFAEDHCDGGSHWAGVISKPYSRQELLRMVEQAVDVRSEADRAQRSNRE